MKKEKIIWLAGIIDGEGSIAATFENPRKYYKKTYLNIVLTVSNTDDRIVQECKNITQKGNLYYHKTKNPKHKNWSRWTIKGHKACWVIRAVLPYLISKQEQAEVALSWENIEKFIGYHKKGTSVITQKAMNERKSIYNKMKKLNKRGA